VLKNLQVNKYGVSSLNLDLDIYYMMLPTDISLRD